MLCCFTYQNDLEFSDQIVAQRVLKFLVHLKNGPEFAIFPNLLKTYSKVVKAQNKCVFHHLGGTLAWKTGLHFFWHQKSNFLALEMFF